MKKYILSILLLSVSVLSMNAAEPEALLLNEGALHNVLLSDVQRITFSGDELLLKNGGGETAFLLDDIAKISFGNMIITGVPVVETQCIASLPANIIGYYSILGTRLPKEPASGIYIIVYDNGTAEKVVK